MELSEWIKQKSDRKKILITNDLNFGNALLQNLQNSTFGVRSAIIIDLAKEICAMHFAETDEEYQFINVTYASALLRKLMLEHVNDLTYFNNPDVLDDYTVQNIYRYMTLMRDNHFSKDQAKLNQRDARRINDLVWLRNAYVNELKKRHLVDYSEAMRIAIEDAHSWKANRSGYGPIAVIQERAVTLSAAEKDLIASLQKFTNTNGEPAIVDLPEYFHSFENESKLVHCKVSFFKAYGPDNETKFVIHDILKNGYPYGSVSLEYLSDDQEQFITGSLQNAGIPYAFINGRSLEANPVIQIALQIIRWAQNDFDMEEFKPLLRNPLLNSHGAGYHAIDLLTDTYGMKYVIGWGYERYEEYLKRLEELLSENEKLTDNQKKRNREAIGLVRTILHVIDPSDSSASALLARMIHFLTKNATINEKTQPVVDQLKNLQAFLAFEDIDDDPYEILSEQIAGLQTRDHCDGTMIKVEKLSRLHLLDRPHIYVIGLTASNAGGGRNESPVMRDEEMNTLLSGGYVPTSGQEAERTRRNILRTLSSAEKAETLSLGFSDFDYAKMVESNPSAIWESLRELYNVDDQDIPEFIFGNPAESREIPLPETEFPDGKYAFDYKKAISPSSMAELAECPQKYFYDKVLNLREPEPLDRLDDTWLSPMEAGNFVHSVLETYCNEEFGSIVKDAYPAELDEDKFEDVYSRLLEEERINIPRKSEAAIEAQMTPLHDGMKEYLKYLHHDYQKSGYEFLCAETKFENVPVPIGKGLITAGRIDRIDCRIDPDNKNIELRVIDYKTGKTTVNNAMEQGYELQGIVYTSALGNEAFEQQLLEILSKKYPDESFDEYQFAASGFHYEVIKEYAKETPKGAEIDGLKQNALAQTRLAVMLDEIEKFGYFVDKYTVRDHLKDNFSEDGPVDGVNLVAGILQKYKAKKDSFTYKKSMVINCNYCPFKETCGKAVKEDVFKRK